MSRRECSRLHDNDASHEKLVPQEGLGFSLLFVEAVVASRSSGAPDEKAGSFGHFSSAASCLVGRPHIRAIFVLVFFATRRRPPFQWSAGLRDQCQRYPEVSPGESLPDPWGTEYLGNLSGVLGGGRVGACTVPGGEGREQFMRVRNAAVSRGDVFCAESTNCVSGGSLSFPMRGAQQRACREEGRARVSQIFAHGRAPVRTILILWPKKLPGARVLLLTVLSFFDVGRVHSPLVLQVLRVPGVVRYGVPSDIRIVRPKNKTKGQDTR